MPATDYAAWSRNRAINISGANGAGAVMPLALDSDVFARARSGGLDLRVYDQTADALVDFYLIDWDPVSLTGLLEFEAVDDSHVHRLLYGNPAGTSVASFANTYRKGTGFDSGWGDLSTAVAGNGAATRYAKPADLSDPRSHEFWRLAESPLLTIAQVRAEIPSLDAGYTGVRELCLLRDANNRVLKVNGKYLWFFCIRANVNTLKLETYTAESDSLDGPLSNFRLAYSPPDTVRLGCVGSAIKVGSTYYLYLYYGGTVGASTLTGLGNRVATSTDLVTWTTATELFANGNLNDPQGGSVNVSGVPWVVPLADGTYWLVVEGYNDANATDRWSVYSLHSSTPAGPFAADNSGNPMIGVGTSGAWDDESAANPKGMELPDGSYLIQYNGASAVVEDFKVGFATCATRAGSYTKRASNPQIGRDYTAGYYGVETSCYCFDEAGTGTVCVVQRFDTASTAGQAYRVYPRQEQGGLLLTRATTDAAIAGYVLGSGTFAIEADAGWTAHPTINSSATFLALWNAAAMVSADTSTNHTAKRCIELGRRSFDQSSIKGDITFAYWDTGGTRQTWTGSAWSSGAVVNLAADAGRDIRWGLADDGTNYLMSARYADTGELVTSASVAKTSVRSFSSGRLLIVGDPFTDAWAGGQWFRYVAERPYVASVPTASLGSLASAGGPRKWWPGLRRSY